MDLAARLHRRSIALSVLSVTVDGASDWRLIPRMLTAVAGLALRLVLTVTLVMVQLAMGQFSPRIDATILQDKPNHFAIGIFVATFAHAMLALSQ